MSVWTLPLFVLVSLCAAGFSPAQAGQPAQARNAGSPESHTFRGRHRPPPIDAILEAHADRLGLDAATRDRIRGIAEASRAEEAPLDERLDDLEREMRRLLRGASPDEKAVMSQADRIGAVRTERHKHRLRTMLRIRALLTPAQREELVRIYKERKARRGAP
jgi:Spy/CpxP family protein refolding chaperone